MAYRRDNAMVRRLRARVNGRWPRGVALWLGAAALLVGLGACSPATGVATSGTAATATPPVVASASATPAVEASAREVVERFYDRYIALPQEDLARAHRESDLLTEGFVQKVEAARTAMTDGGGDPIICAQDVPTSVKVLEPIIDGDQARAVVQTSFEGHAFTVTLNRAGGSWRIADVTCEATAADLALDTTQWLTYRAAEYGLWVDYPQGWEAEEAFVVDQDGTNPTEMVVALAPLEYAAGVAPISIEMSRGTLEEFRTVYPEPEQSDTIDVNGLSVRVERYGPEETFYIFQSPLDEDVRVIVRDTTFLATGEQAPLYQAVLRAMLGTVRFE